MSKRTDEIIDEWDKEHKERFGFFDRNLSSSLVMMLRKLAQLQERIENLEKATK